jgi:hypothetical protein
MGAKRNAYRILVVKQEAKRPLGRPRCRWEDNIRMDLREMFRIRISSNVFAQIPGGTDHYNTSAFITEPGSKATANISLLKHTATLDPKVSVRPRACTP